MNDSAPGRVSDSALEELRNRLAMTRRIPLPRGTGWARGMDADYLDSLLSYWRDTYDWRSHEDRILELPWVNLGEGDRALRVVYAPGAKPAAPVVVLLHGWPDSVLRFERLLPLLSEFTVVVPALPGFPFAHELATSGMSVAVMAELVAGALHELGHERYVISAGDVGSDIAEHLSVQHPDRVAALHLTNLSPLHAAFADPSAVSPPEREYLARAAQWQRTEGGYIAEQSSKPHTLAVGLGDSPAGLASWIVEKVRSWSDCAGDIESVFSKDELLTWVMAYWTTGVIGTSFAPYVEFAKPVDYVSTPTFFSAFPADTKPAPRVFVERYVNVQKWTDQPSGGHFAAWERPQAYADDLRRACETEVARYSS